MKNLKSLLLILTAAIVMAVGCKKGDEPTPPTPPAPPVTTALDFDIQVADVDMVSITYSVIPSISDAEYLHVVVREDAISSMDSLSVASSILDEMEETASYQGKTLAEYLPEYVSVGNVLEEKATGLVKATDYALVVFGVDLEAENRIGDTHVKIIPFSTEDVEKVECTFDITVETESTTANISVVPSNKECVYHLMMVGKDYFEGYTDPSNPDSFTIEEFYTEYLKVYVQGLQSQGMTIEEIHQAIFVSGDNDFEATGLTPNSSYQCLAGVIEIRDDSYLLLSDVTLKDFTTDAPEHNGMTFDIQVSNITSNSAQISLTPSDPTATYCWLIGQYDGESTAVELMNKIVAEYAMFMNMGIMLSTGNQYYEEYSTNIFPNTEYSIIAFGYSGGITSDPTLVTFKTLPPEHDPADCEFEVSFMNQTPYYFDVEIIPTDKTVYYSPNICLPEQFDADRIASELERKFEEMLFAYNNDPQMIGEYLMSDIIYYTCYDDDRVVTAQGLEPETTYTFYICVVDVTTGKVLKVVDYPSAVTTPALGTMATEPQVLGYYSGDDEAGQIFGDRPATAGKAIAAVRFDADPLATGIFATYLREDDMYPYMDEEVSPDYYLYGLLKGDGNFMRNIVDQPYGFYLVGWREDWVVFSCATDQNGVYGDMSRTLINATPQNKGDIQELIDLINMLDSASQTTIPYRPVEFDFKPVPYIPFSGNEVRSHSFDAANASAVQSSSFVSANSISQPRISKVVVF
ncbi:MAG: hypothetical protein IKC17_05625 [Bacteroidales bacterium]|nr:hypothetical protein [Bacteroidales bacterium]